MPSPTLLCAAFLTGIGLLVGVHGPHRWVRWLGSFVNSFDSSNGCVGLATDGEMATIAAWVRSAHAGTIELR